MKKFYRKSESGIISIFVIFSMFFLFVFVITSYYFFKEKIKINKLENIELQKKYSNFEGNDSATSNEIIPIYNITQLNLVGTGDYLKINNKIYQLGRGSSYILKNDIIVDIEEDLQYGNIGFNDYKLDSNKYYIDTFNHELKYFKNGDYWKVVVHEKYGDKNNAEENNYLLINNYEILPNSIFMIIWKKNNDFSNCDVMQNSNKIITNINDIDVYNKNYNNLDFEKGEFYIFIKL